MPSFRKEDASDFMQKQPDEAAGPLCLLPGGGNLRAPAAVTFADNRPKAGSACVRNITGDAESTVPSKRWIGLRSTHRLDRVKACMGHFTFNSTDFAACSVFFPSRRASTTNGWSADCTQGSA